MYIYVHIYINYACREGAADDNSSGAREGGQEMPGTVPSGAPPMPPHSTVPKLQPTGIGGGGGRGGGGGSVDFLGLLDDGVWGGNGGGGGAAKQATAREAAAGGGDILFDVFGGPPTLTCAAHPLPFALAAPLKSTTAGRGGGEGGGDLFDFFSAAPSSSHVGAPSGSASGVPGSMAGLLGDTDPFAVAIGGGGGGAGWVTFGDSSTDDAFAKSDPFAASANSDLFGHASNVDPFAAAFANGSGGGYAHAGFEDDPFAELTAQLHLTDDGPSSVQHTHAHTHTHNPAHTHTHTCVENSGTNFLDAQASSGAGQGGVAGGVELYELRGQAANAKVLNPFDAMDIFDSPASVHTAAAPIEAHTNSFTDPFLELFSTTTPAAASSSSSMSLMCASPVKRTATPLSSTAAPLVAQPPLPLVPPPPTILPPPLAVPPPPPSLPHGWEAAWSDEDKDYYFFREDTGKVNWNLPN